MWPRAAARTQKRLEAENAELRREVARLNKSLEQEKSGQILVREAYQAECDRLRRDANAASEAHGEAEREVAFYKVRLFHGEKL